MKKALSVILFSTMLLTGIGAFAGGVECKQCPAESSACVPRLDCDNPWDRITDIENGRCPNEP